MTERDPKYDFIHQYLTDISNLALSISHNELEMMVDSLVNLRNREGRLFCIGVGGGAANASHAVNDFRKICNIEAYAPTDNVAELTARTNDEGWDTIFEEWLRVSKINWKDGIFVFSVGGGDLLNKVSVPICNAFNTDKHPLILGIVGRDGGETKRQGDRVIVIPTFNEDLVTAYTESFQIILLHAIVFHPKLMVNKGKWESIEKQSPCPFCGKDFCMERHYEH